MEVIIGLIGIIIGIVLTEFIRRTNRIESFNNQIFNERLKAFIDLYRLMQDTYVQVNEYIDNFNNYEHKIWNEIVSDTIFSIVRFTDENGFLISEQLKLQCCALYMGLEDIDSKSKDSYISELQEQHKNTIIMIQNESGINQINKKIKDIIKHNHESPVIEYYNILKKKKRKVKMPSL